VLETFETVPSLGRLVVERDGEAVGAGIVL
jgi:hypothetical protein